jgi:hypothetical protein
MTRLINKSPTLHERLSAEHKRTEAAIAVLAPGSERDNLMEKLRQLDVTADIDLWLSSPGLRVPT